VSTTSPTLGIYLNDQPHALEGPSTLLAVLGGLGFADRRGVAAAVNGEVVPRASWESRVLAEKDRVIVIRATQGG
jgi:sulfur carrier protein